MKCESCNGLNFDVIIPSLLGYPYIECSDCKRGYIVLDKLKLRPAELLGNVKDNTDNCIMFNCAKCKGLRLVESTRNDLVQSTQLCNSCIAYIARVSGEDTVSEIVAGEKMTWEEFLGRAHNFE